MKHFCIVLCSCFSFRFGLCFFSSQVSSGDLSGHLLVKSPSPWDSDDRGIFCLYLFPGTTKHKKVFLLILQRCDFTNESSAY